MTLDVNTIQLISKFTELGIKYLESRQKRKVDLAEAGVVDSVDEALREFEELDVPKAYAIPDDEPLLIPPKSDNEEPV